MQLVEPFNAIISWEYCNILFSEKHIIVIAEAYVYFVL